jgi:chromosomal replication initiator protein
MNPYLYPGLRLLERSLFVSKILARKGRRLINAQTIINIVVSHFNLTSDDLKSASRKKEIVTARHWAMFILRKEFGITFSKIGEFFPYYNRFKGKKVPRDHATVRHACIVTQNHIDSYTKDRENYVLLLEKLNST